MPSAFTCFLLIKLLGYNDVDICDCLVDYLLHKRFQVTMGSVKLFFDLSMLSNTLLSNECVLAWSQCLLDDIASIYILFFFIN